MNVAIQYVCHSFISSHPTTLRRSSVTDVLQNIIAIWNGNSVADGQQLIELLGFNPILQHDAVEALIKLMQGLGKVDRNSWYMDHEIQLECSSTQESFIEYGETGPKMIFFF